MLTKQPRSSFFALNIDILWRYFAGGTSVVGSDVGDRQKRQDAMSKGVGLHSSVTYVSNRDLRGYLVLARSTLILSVSIFVMTTSAKRNPTTSMGQSHIS